MPWPVLLVAAIIMVTCIYLIVGSTISLIVSILQKGF